MSTADALNPPRPRSVEDEDLLALLGGHLLAVRRLAEATTEERETFYAEATATLKEVGQYLGCDPEPDTAIVAVRANWYQKDSQQMVYVNDYGVEGRRGILGTWRYVEARDEFVPRLEPPFTEERHRWLYKGWNQWVDDGSPTEGFSGPYFDPKSS